MALLASLFVAAVLCSNWHVHAYTLEELADRLGALEETIRVQADVIQQQQNEIDILRAQSSSERFPGRRMLLDSEGPVAFSAVLAPVVIEHVHSNMAIKFDTMLSNFGGGYNNDTGIFVAPLKGIYLISSSILDHMKTGSHGNVMVHGEIVRNHEVLARVFAHAENEYRDQGANTVIVQLNAGDQVYVRTVDNNDLGLGGDRYTSFSGYLLWPQQ